MYPLNPHALKSRIKVSGILIPSFILFCLTFLGSGATEAQTNVLINTGSPGTPEHSPGPVYRSSSGSNFDASRYCYLYTGAELSAAGIEAGAIITEVAWIKANNDSARGPAILNIYMNNTFTADFAVSDSSWFDLIAEAKAVYTDSNYVLPSTAAPDYIPIVLSKPFVYTGGSLEIAVEWDISGLSGTASSGTFNWLWTVVSNRILGTGQTSLANAGLLSSTGNGVVNFDDRRPVIRLTHVSAPCVNPPVPGIAVSDDNGFTCPSGQVILDLSGQSVGIGQKYHWESAAAVSGPYSSLGTPSSFPGQLVQSSVTTFYRAAVHCGADTQYSVPVQVVIHTGLAGGIYTIDNTLPTGSTNFNTFTEAVNAITCGISGPVMFDIPGHQVFNEQIDIGQIPGSSAINTVVFRGHGATVTAIPSSDHRAIIRLNGGRHIRFDSLNIVGTGNVFGWGVQLMNGADSNVISNCLIDLTALTNVGSTNGVGIVISDSENSIASAGNGSYNDFLANTIRGGTTGLYYGIRLNGVSGGSSCVGNRIIDNIIENIYYYNIHLDQAQGTIIRGNDISRSGKTTVGIFQGIYLGEGCTSTLIENNRIHNTHDMASSQTGTAYGIYFSGSDATGSTANVVRNNLICNFNSEGTVYGIYNRSSDFAHYYYNTISLDHVPASGGSMTFGFYQTAAAAGIGFFNNVVSITRGGSSVKHGLFFDSNTSAIQCDNNVIYVRSAGSGAQFTGQWDGTDHAYFKSWQAANASAFDQLSDSLDPVFVDLTGDDYQPNSLTADGLAIPVPGATKDILGVLRHPATPDPGAFEFTPLPLNDSCHRAIQVGPGLTFGTTVGSTADLAPVCMINDAPSGGLWYKYPANGAHVSFSLCGSFYDTRLRVFEGTCGSLVCKEGNEDFCMAQSYVDFCADSGTVYFLLVYGNGPDEGEFTLTTVETPVKPAKITASAPAFCPGDSVVLTADSAASYQWNDPARSTGRQISVRNDGKFFVVTADTNDCTDTSAITTISMFSVIPPVISVVNGHPAFCTGDSIQLTTKKAVAYLWNDAAMSTSQTIEIKQPGNFVVYVVDSNGCGAYSDTLTSMELPLPVVTLGNDTVICAGQTLLLDAGPDFSSYHWNNGATSRYIQIAEGPGQYAISIEVEDENGCRGKDEMTVKVELCAGVDFIGLPSPFSIYPNPGNGRFTIDCALYADSHVEAIVTDISGRVLFDSILEFTGGRALIDLSSLPDGMYILHTDHPKTAYLLRISN